MSYLGWRKYKSAQDRILQNIKVDPISKCWVWQKFRDKDGYGKTYDIEHHVQRAHQLAYIAFIDDYDRNLLICHKCNNPSCANPEHLYVGTHKNNAYDKVSNNTHPAGILNPNNKLTEKEVLEIRDLCKFLTLKEISKLYNIWPTAVHKIKHRVTWRHV